MHRRCCHGPWGRAWGWPEVITLTAPDAQRRGAAALVLWPLPPGGGALVLGALAVLSHVLSCRCPSLGRGDCSGTLPLPLPCDEVVGCFLTLFCLSSQAYTPAQSWEETGVARAPTARRLLRFYCGVVPPPTVFLVPHKRTEGAIAKAGVFVLRAVCGVPLGLRSTCSRVGAV